jgi:soluble lytic murein transglycosylase-like protein
VIVKKTATTGLTLSSAILALTVAGCSSVEKTPIEQLMAVQTVVPTSKPGEKIEGLPSADDPVAENLPSERDIAAGQKALEAATAEAVQSDGPTVELAAASGRSSAQLAYAKPNQPSASEAIEAKMEAMRDTRAFDVSAPASIMASADRHTSHPKIDALIAKYSALYGVPKSLVHHVAKRESTYNPKAYRNGNYGLMQIRYRTAKGMGYHGSPKGLFDAETNLKYAVKYLRGAWLVADKDAKAADWLYRTGYYYQAKRKGMLDEVQ